MFQQIQMFNDVYDPVGSTNYGKLTNIIPTSKESAEVIATTVVYRNLQTSGLNSARTSQSVPTVINNNVTNTFKTFETQ